MRWPSRPCGLARLAADPLAAVHHALALVRLWRAQAADVGGDLTDVLDRDAADRELGRVLHVDGDALRRLEADRVRVAEVQHQLLALLGDAVAHADELEVLGETLVHALDHVGDEAAHQAVERTVPEVLRRSLEDELAVVLLDRDLGRQGALELALRTLDLHVPGRERDRHVRRHLDRELSDSRQLFFLFS